MLEHVAPLLLVGIGACVAFKAKAINLGCEGQIAVGAVCSVAVAVSAPDMPALMMLPLAMAAGAAAGVLWVLVPGWMKAYRGVHEVLTTVMFNLLAVQVFYYLSTRTGVPLFERFELLADNRFALLRGSGVDLVVAVALVSAVAAWMFMARTTSGLRLRAVGENTQAAYCAGIPIQRTVMSAFIVSGALCGLAGAVIALSFNVGISPLNLGLDVSGVLDELEGGSLVGSLYAFPFIAFVAPGLAAALVARLHPLWTVVSSCFFAFTMQKFAVAFQERDRIGDISDDYAVDVGDVGALAHDWYKLSGLTAYWLVACVVMLACVGCAVHACSKLVKTAMWRSFVGLSAGAPADV